MDQVITSTLEGISLALSMDDPLGFTAMNPISQKPEIQGEPPQVSSVSSPVNQGEQPSTVSPLASPINISSYMDMLVGSKAPKHSDPLKQSETFTRFEDQLLEVK